MAFSSKESSFSKGFTNFSHIYERLEDHETSKAHNSAALAYFNAEAGNDIENLINRDMVNYRKRKIFNNVKEDLSSH